jgi:hypothetical protein
MSSPKSIVALFGLMPCVTPGSSPERVHEK